MSTKKSLFLLSFVSLILACPAVLCAEGIAVNFVGDGQAVPANEGFGYLGQTDWNNVTGASGGPSNLVNPVGSPSVSLTWSSFATGSGVMFNDPATNTQACNGCTGPQDGAGEVLSGIVKAQNSFGQATPGPQIDISLSGLSSVFTSYDVFVYFNSTPDQGDQYNVTFDDSVNSVITQVPISPNPIVSSQGGGGGRSVGQFYGYDDNFTLIGDTSAFGGRGNDSVAVTSALQEPLNGDTLSITIMDTNNNGNNGDPTGLGGPNFGPNADLGVAGIQIVGTVVPEPAAIVLLGFGLMGLSALRLSRKK